MRIEYEHWSLVPKLQWGWSWFTPEEMADRRTGRLLVDTRLLDKLDILRGMYDRPIIISSGYRGPYSNAKAGGAVFSQHLLGKAADAKVGDDRERLLALAKTVGMTGIGMYNTFLHMDIRVKPAEWGEW